MSHNIHYDTAMKYIVLDVIKKDNQIALEHFLQAANERYFDAYYHIARIYALGEGVKKDYTKSIHYYQLGIEHYNAKCYLGLALLYYHGHGVKTDLDMAKTLAIQAFNTLEKESGKLDITSMYLLGLYYYYGLNETKNFVKAYELFKKAADLNYSDAQYMVGLLLESMFKEEDKKEIAKQYYHLAAKQGHVFAQYGLAIMYFEEKNEIKAVELLEKATKQNYDVAYYTLGVYYDERTDSKYEIAFQNFIEAAKLGYAPSYYYVGLYYYQGLGIKKDLAKAKQYLELGVLNQSDRAMYQYAMFLIKEEKNYQQAASLLIEAAKKDHPFAQYNLAVMYQRGEGIEKDVHKAFLYFQQAANHQLPRAKYNLGLMYFRGDGVEKDQEKAYQLWKEASDLGLEEANTLLIRIENAKKLDDTL